MWTCKRGNTMSNMKKMIVRYMQTITFVLISFILIVTIISQILSAQRYAKVSAEALFVQIRQIMQENAEELVIVQTEYKQTCLNNAQAIAHIVEADPDILNDLEAMRKMAVYMEVDEIHFFDEEGKIFTGTHPEYYGMDMNSGEQIGFFKPMLTDKSLSMIQDITPNTAEERPMQYSARWNESGTFIVQVGMEPVNVLKVTEKNELSYIFSLLLVNTGVSIYAIDKETGEIKGATVSEDVGKDCQELGFDLEDIESRGDGYHTTIKGLNSFCVFTEIDGNLIGRVVPAGTLYHNIQINACAIAIYLIIITVMLILSVTRYLDKTVIKGIEQINGKLCAITEGNLDETVDVQTCLEFAELSKHSNEMIKALLSDTDKISYVLNKTDVPIGVYEYNTKMSKVRYTEHVPGILSLKKAQAEELFSDSAKFADYIGELRQNPLEDEDDIYRLNGKNTKYIRLEELTKQNDVLGIIIDETEEITKRKMVEEERDTDILTGLYNRRGLENKLADLFDEPEKLKHGAMVMVDADCLKEINDKYGHDKGDIYLCKIAGILSSFGPNSCVISRYGGDEFVLFLYEYENAEELENTVKTLGFIQDNSIAHLSDKISVPLRFSYGYCLFHGEADYEKLIKCADDRMYENKKSRKMERK